MANLILSEAKELHEVSKFPGVNRRVSSNAYSCRNFRILPDGAIEKREGFYPMTSLPGIPRAAWCGNVFGEEKIFCLVDNVIYEVNCQNEGATELGCVSTVKGKADFFYCRGGLYLIDGQDIYSVSSSGVEREEGYVPVYGRDWPGLVPGEINEPVNFLSDRIIIHFKLIDASYTYMELGIKCTEILGCTLNGAPFDGKADLQKEGTRIRLSSAVPTECEMCFLLRIDPSMYRRDEIISVTGASQSGGDMDTKVLLFGGNDKSRLFSLREVEDRSFYLSEEMTGESTRLYFPVSDTVILGDGREEVTAAVPYGGQMLIFTETGGWLGDFSGKNEPKITRISEGVGCLAPNGAVVGKYAYTVTKSGIFRWDSAKRFGTSYAVCISDPIKDLMSSGFCRGAVAYYSALHGEIWFADPDSDENRVLVYREESGVWYTFDGIPAHRFFCLNGYAAFLSGRYLLEFSDDHREDIVFNDMENGGRIEAEYVSCDMDFNSPERHKRIRRVLGEAKSDEDEFKVILEGDRMKKPTVVSVPECDVGRGITYFDSRVNTGRFCRMRFRILSSGRGRTRIEKIAFAVFK